MNCLTNSERLCDAFCKSSSSLTLSPHSETCRLMKVTFENLGELQQDIGSKSTFGCQVRNLAFVVNSPLRVEIM